MKKDRKQREYTPESLREEREYGMFWYSWLWNILRPLALALCVLLVVVFGIAKDTYIPLVLGHVTLCAPFVYLSVIPKLKQMDSSHPSTKSLVCF